MLLERQVVANKHDPRQFHSKVGQTIFLSLLGLALFWDLSGNDFVSQMSLAGFLFHSAINTVMTHLMGNLLTFQEERPVFLREYANKMYNVGPYFSAKVITEIPIMIIQPLLYAIINYFGVGLTVTAGQFFYFYLILLILTISASSLGYFLSSLFS